MNTFVKYISVVTLLLAIGVIFNCLCCSSSKEETKQMVITHIGKPCIFKSESVTGFCNQCDEDNNLTVFTSCNQRGGSCVSKQGTFAFYELAYCPRHPGFSAKSHETSVVHKSEYNGPVSCKGIKACNSTEGVDPYAN